MNQAVPQRRLRKPGQNNVNAPSKRLIKIKQLGIRGPANTRTPRHEQRAKLRGLAMHLRGLRLTEAVEQQCPGAVFADQRGELVLHLRRAKPKGRGGGHNLSAVSHREQRLAQTVAQPPGIAHHGHNAYNTPNTYNTYKTPNACNPHNTPNATNTHNATNTTNACNNLVGHEREQSLLVRHVMVERTRLHLKLGSDTAHRAVFESLSVEHTQRRGNHIGSTVAHRPSLALT